MIPRLLTAIMMAVVVIAGEPPLAAAPRPVSYRAGDRVINAIVHEPVQRPAPAVILVPMLGRPKEDWQAVGQRLADANITALLIDLPGQVLPGDAAAATAWGADIRAAIDYLLSRGDVRNNVVGIAGASLGANLAAVVAASDERVRTLALVSPTLDYRGVRIEAAMRQYGARPALMVAAHADYYSARSARTLADNPPGVREVYWADEPAHGTMLIARQPDLVRVLVEWFERTLP